MPPTTSKTRILILSDTHSVPPLPSTPSPHLPYTLPLPPADILIHCGDLTNTGRLSEHLTTFQWIAEHPAPLKLVVAGNHDVTIDGAWYREKMRKGGWMGHGGGKDGEGREDVERCREVWCGEEARRRGVVYLEEGVRELDLGGGKSVVIYSSPYTPEYCDWAFPYPRHLDRFNPPCAPQPIPSHPTIDILITHGPPFHILDKALPSAEHVGCSHLRTAVERCKPRIHCFGHIHEGWGAERMDWKAGEVRKVELGEKERERVVRERGVYLDLTEGSAEGLRWGEETVFMNAAVMDVGYRPVNAPWIVDLDLPVRGEAG